MPYQDGYVPEYNYSNHSGQYGQAQYGFQQQQQQQQPQQQRPPQQHTYQQNWHTPYATPQAFDPSQGQASFYQTPNQPARQQQYLSPPSQPALIQQNVQYSPDPLHHFQPPPQPRQQQQQAFYAQQQAKQAQRPLSQSSQTQQTPRPQGSHRQPVASPQWTQYPSSPSPYETSGPSSRAPTSNSPYATAQQAQQQQQPPPPQRSHQQVSHPGQPSSQMAQGQKNRPMPSQQHSQARMPSQAMPSQPHKQSGSSQQRPSPVVQNRVMNDRPSQPTVGQFVQHNNLQQVDPSVAHSFHEVNTPTQAKRPSVPQNNFRPPSSSRQVQSTPSTITVDPSMLQRPNSTIKAQPQRPSIKLERPEVRSPKRRRSNDGTALPIDNQPERHAASVKHEPESKSSRQMLQSKPVPASSPLTELASSQLPPTPTPLTSVDYQAALLALSDEYISAAYSMTGPLSGKEASDELLDQYQNLLSTGLGCLDSVLKNYRISDPRKEARIRLRYASLLYEETENLTDAEECLSKGISLCERARLTDLKYAMHHLTARIWFKSRKFKTAMKTVERMTAEVEKLQLLHWVYAFHFLRVSFGLQIPDNHHETVSLVRYLSALSAVATRHYHVSVQIVAHTIEALVHLRARTSDSIDLANRAMASARMHQLTPEMQAMPQVKALLNYLDVGCSLTRFNRKVADSKVQAMQLELDQGTHDEAWTNRDGCALHISLGHSKDAELEADSGGVFQQGPNGDVCLAFSWLTKQQAYAVGYLISGLSKLDGSTGPEAAKYLSHVVTMSRTVPKDMSLSLSAATSRWHMQVSLRATARLYIAFAFCGISDWPHAINALQAYREKDVPQLEGAPDAAFTTLATYLDAVVKHGSGDLEEALRLYRSPALQVPLLGSTESGMAPMNPIKVLSALNSVEILHSQGKSKEAGLLLDWTEPYCVVTRNSDGGEHGSRAMESLFCMLKAVASQRAGGLIIDTKSILQRSVKAAQAVGNDQLLMCVMNIMTDAWFKNIVGQQAVSSGKSARGLAGKNNNKLWRAVGTRMYADTLELSGQLGQAEEMRQDAQQLMANLPPNLRDAFQKGKTN
ncbi:hypothetical protein CB0940_03079 [Cercospora beticola]|uniref:MAU2 chromatid cohesion factor n=1 Tax=Cercospora beticola TaxID=122368 RepID=A0A2G5I1K1_CERBT|nr:hypothetical protein CB0940_03079 [Cercospora beticola]PIA98631.1 hypothetical protein CB0940_03079 [Cercospora beticola]WPB00245.1 hypothetical protein RHO25_004864 [Cercospora beticola]CAK1361559.1 unnamed protein product [Cercospora beticola]